MQGLGLGPGLFSFLDPSEPLPMEVVYSLLVARRVPSAVVQAGSETTLDALDHDLILLLHAIEVSPGPFIYLAAIPDVGLKGHPCSRRRDRAYVDF